MPDQVRRDSAIKPGLLFKQFSVGLENGRVIYYLLGIIPGGFAHVVAGGSDFFATGQKSHQKTPPLLKKLLKINALR
jgi:hypothetical protein